MKPEDLTEEQKAKLKSCKDHVELRSMLSTMGIELTDEQLEEASGGDSAVGWERCNRYVPPCENYM